MTSQLSSLSSLTVSQAHLNSTNNTSSSDGSQRDIITATTSMATDISEWCDPDTDTELNIIVDTDTKTASDELRRDTASKEELLIEDQRIIEYVQLHYYFIILTSTKGWCNYIPVYTVYSKYPSILYLSPSLPPPPSPPPHSYSSCPIKSYSTICIYCIL